MAYLAARNGHTDVMRWLLARKANVNLGKKNDTSPLYVAVQEGHLEMARLLVENGADPLAVNIHGTAPVFVAAQEGHLEVVTFLVQHKADPNLKNLSNSTPLMIACQEGRTEVVSYLLSLGITGEGDDRSVAIASKRGHHAIVAQLLENNFSPQPAGPWPLAEGCSCKGPNGEKVVQLLLEAHAPIYLPKRTSVGTLCLYQRLLDPNQGHVPAALLGYAPPPITHVPNLFNLGINTAHLPMLRALLEWIPVSAAPGQLPPLKDIANAEPLLPPIRQTLVSKRLHAPCGPLSLLDSITLELGRWLVHTQVRKWPPPATDMTPNFPALRVDPSVLPESLSHHINAVFSSPVVWASLALDQGLPPPSVNCPACNPSTPPA
jgi:hypothetical protein